MFYTNGNYAAFSKPRKPANIEARKAYIIGGGLAVSITALISRGRREDRDARAEASARAREHMLNPEQVD